MRLTDYEKAMLNGEHGEMRQQAMQALCDLASFYDVENFVEIVGCHDDSTVYAGEAQVAFAEHLANKGQSSLFRPPQTPPLATSICGTAKSMMWRPWRRPAASRLRM